MVAERTASARGSDATREGPALETLLQRLSETPAEFLAQPQYRRQAGVHVEAVIADLLFRRGLEPDLSRVATLLRESDRNARSVSLLLCWLLDDESLHAEGMSPSETNPAPTSTDLLLELLGTGACELAAHTACPTFISDPERREELARFSLQRLGLRPLGETPAQAEDRLTSLSAAERARVLSASREAEARARAVREALAKKAAEESADKWSRE